jgi:hypothetical protein
MIMRFVRKLASVWTDRWLIGLIVASLILPPAYYGLVAYQSRVATFAAADRQLIGVVKLLREHVQKVFDTDELVIKLVDRLTAGLSWDEIAHSERLHLLLKQLDDELPQVNGIYLVAPDGTVASSSRVFPVRPSNLGDRAYFTSLRDGYQGSFISDVHPALQVSCNSMLLGVDLPWTVRSMASSSYLTIRLISRMPTAASATVQRP